MDIRVARQLQLMKTGTSYAYRLLRSGRVSIQWMMVNIARLISVAGGMAGMVQDATFAVIPIHLIALVSRIEELHLQRCCLGKTAAFR